MQSKTIVILADPNEFPQAQYYAHCYSVLFDDMGFRLVRNAYKPFRGDYTKVYIATKDKKKYAVITDEFAKFDCEFVDDIPDYRKKEDKVVSAWLVKNEFTEPFDDLKARRKKEEARKRFDASVKASEAKGDFADPDPEAKLNPQIKLLRKTGKGAE
jgi:hypothetical protein